MPSSTDRVVTHLIIAAERPTLGWVHQPFVVQRQPGQQWPGSFFRSRPPRGFESRIHSKRMFTADQIGRQSDLIVLPEPIVLNEGQTLSVDPDGVVWQHMASLGKKDPETCRVFPPKPAPAVQSPPMTGDISASLEQAGIHPRYLLFKNLFMIAGRLVF